MLPSGLRERTVPCRNCLTLIALLFGAACQKDATSPPTVAVVTIVLPSGNLAVSQSMQLSAVAKDASGTPRTATLTWTSSDERVATVSSRGLVTAIAAGVVDIIATANGIRGQGRLMVYVAGVAARLDVSGPSGFLGLGSTMQLAATAYDAVGVVLTGRAVTWSSSAIAVASVSESGFVTALALGTAVISAKSDGASGSASITVSAPVRFASIALGALHTCGLAADGTASCWGDNIFGMLGTGTFSPSLVPTKVAGNITFASLTVGGSFTCGLTLDGKAWCWGTAKEGQLGALTAFDCDFNGFDLGRCSNRPLALGATFRSLSAGYQHACGLTLDGVAYCWGSNKLGQLGNGTVGGPSLVPVAGGLTFTAISAGGGHTCALTQNGAAYCWGINDFGQLGSGPGPSRAVPTLVAGGLSFISLSVGLAHSCGIVASGETFCWGINVAGTLGVTTSETCPRTGVPPSSCSTRPIAVSGGRVFTSLGTSADAFTTCGVSVAGDAWCWGDNPTGQIGDGTRASRVEPVPVAGNLSFSRVRGGSTHSCGVSTSGITYCWGNNQTGQLGTGSRDGSTIPVRVANQ